MQARGMLMIEHRLIERMIELIGREVKNIRQTDVVDPLFIDTVVDFIKTYADRTHHGKEEEIMFRDLAGKEMSAQDREIMDELVDEHVYGRKVTGRLVEANEKYRHGEKSSLADVIENLEVLVNFYPKHIEKEDKVFFPASKAYLSEEEDQAMVKEFREFDMEMIHEKYRSTIEGLEK